MEDEFNEEINLALNDLSKKINALNNSDRLSLMGLLYLKDKQTFSQIDFYVNKQLDPHKTEYHLNLLIDVGLVKKESDGYSLTFEGIKFLNELGFDEKIEKLKDK